MQDMTRFGNLQTEVIHGTRFSSAKSATKLRSLAIAPSNSNIIYTADQTNMWKTIDGGATDWTFSYFTFNIQQHNIYCSKK